MSTSTFGLLAPVQTVRIENFRGVRDLTIELDEHVTVFFGVNAAGKTTLLDALAIGLGAYITRVPKAKGLSFQKHGDIRIRMLVRDYKGPGNYVLDGVSIEAPGKHFEKARGDSGTLSVQNDTDGWVSGTFNFHI